LKQAIDQPTLGFIFQRQIESAMAQLAGHPDDPALLERPRTLIGLAKTLPIRPNFWTTQNLYNAMLHDHAAHVRARSEQGDPAAKAWLESFTALGADLNLNVAALASQAKS
jgi:hypothetical protein